MLHLISITCDDKDDTINKDEPFLKVNGNQVWSGEGFVRGTSRSLASVAAQPFLTTTDIELWEADAAPSPDDYLGTYTARAAESGSGPHTATFSRQGALYRVVYRVA
jgi:hypothetical protein